ncbi:hypothetical protein CBH50_004584 [Salmonella enterica subsp. diarizonae serovar 60:r:e,n,x,z15]|nr:hypothetical protein [Salmonella enterica subsp. diarizonae serovar 60:r:e,n,x,z15]
MNKLIICEMSDYELESVLSEHEYFSASDGECELFSDDEKDSQSISSHFPHSVNSGSSVSRAQSSTSAHRKVKSVKSEKKLSSHNVIKWSVDDRQQRSRYRLGRHVVVDGATMRHYYEWRRIINSGGVHPRQAAQLIGIKMDFKLTKQKQSMQLYSIRLSKEHRVFFTVDEVGKIVNVLNVGGHSFP